MVLAEDRIATGPSGCRARLWRRGTRGTRRDALRAVVCGPTSSESRVASVTRSSWSGHGRGHRIGPRGGWTKNRTALATATPISPITRRPGSSRPPSSELDRLGRRASRPRSADGDSVGVALGVADGVAVPGTSAVGAGGIGSDPPVPPPSGRAVVVGASVGTGVCFSTASATCWAEA